MAHQDRLYYFDELIGGGNECMKTSSVSPSEEEKAVTAMYKENPEKYDTEEYRNSIIANLDNKYIDKTVRISDFLSRLDKSTIRIPKDVREAIESYGKEKKDKVFEEAWNSWKEREEDIEKKDDLMARIKGVTFEQYREQKQNREGDSPRAVAVIQQAIAEAKLREAQQEAEEARTREEEAEARRKMKKEAKKAERAAQAAAQAAAQEIARRQELVARRAAEKKKGRK
jgi:hypothetical protein